VDLREEAPADWVGEPSGKWSGSTEDGGLALVRDLPLDRRPEQVDDLRYDNERGGAVVADRLKDDARVAAPDV